MWYWNGDARKGLFVAFDGVGGWLLTTGVHVLVKKHSYIIIAISHFPFLCALILAIQHGVH